MLLSPIFPTTMNNLFRTLKTQSFNFHHLSSHSTSCYQIISIVQHIVIKPIYFLLNWVIVLNFNLYISHNGFYIDEL